MTAPTAFGRRAPSAPAPSAAVNELSAAARAFRADLGKSQGEDAAFADWRRAQSGRRWIAWGLGFALMTPGFLCFIVQAPMAVSAGLEVGGILVGAWLRRERRRHLAAIRGWEAGA